MKKTALIVFALVNLTALVSAQAAQDPSVAQAVKHHQAAQQQGGAAAPAPQARHAVQLLDHGPRAQSTPWLNAQLRQDAAQAQQARQVAARDGKQRSPTDN
jgi:hypothetical protein